jgi:GntR family transcriptional regulator / MocR family aminotransferase
MPWTIGLDLASAGEPLFLRIVRAITNDIRRGRLRAGTALPGTRTLARMLAVNRNTVVAAFDELTAEGWLTTTRASATRVAANIPEPTALADGVWNQRPAPIASPRPRALRTQPPPGVISLSRGEPDVSLLPAEQLARAYRRALKFGPSSTLSYGDPRGVLALREAIAELVSATRGINATGAQVMVTRGSQMAFALLAEISAPGARIAVEALGYPPAWQALQRLGAEVVPVSVDEDGIRVEELIELHERLPLSAAYVTPHRQYPTTVTLSAGRRLRLLDFASRHGIVLIEDDYDHEFAFSGRPTLPLASMDRVGCVVYVGTLSKVFAPGPRIGFIVTTEERIESLAQRRAILDACGDPAVETAMAELFTSGELRRHINRVRSIYARRREVALESLQRYLADTIEYRVPSGGTALWLHARDGIDVDAWAAAAEKRGVTFHTGRWYSLVDRSLPNIRLNFAAVGEEQIVKAVEVMRRSLTGLRRT